MGEDLGLGRLQPETLQSYEKVEVDDSNESLLLDDDRREEIGVRGGWRVIDDDITISSFDYEVCRTWERGCRIVCRGRIC